MNNETIVLNQGDLQQLFLRLMWLDEDVLANEDARVLEQIRRFFTANLHLARYVADIQELALVPRGEGQPPHARVTVIHQHRIYRLTSDEDGRVPHIRC